MLATRRWLSNRMILGDAWEVSCYNLLASDRRHFRTDCVAASPGISGVDEVRRRRASVRLARSLFRISP
jgi:hypothetical protein